MLSFLEPKQTNSSQYMRFSKVFQGQQDAAPKRDKRVQAIQTAEQLLQTPERTLLIQEIQDVCAANAQNYQTYYESLIKRFAEFVQLLGDFDHPAHTWLDHHLRLAKTSLKMREQFLLVGESLQPIVGEEAALWHYVTFSSALLRKIGLLFTHYQVSLCNEQGAHEADWQPFAGNMGNQGNYYKLRDILTQDIPMTQNISQLLARQIMPEEGFNWIAKNPKALMEWLGVVEGDQGTGGVSNRFVILSEQQLYENAQREAVLEQLYRARSLEEFLKLTGLNEQQLLKLLPPLHGVENETTELNVAFFEWLEIQHQQQNQEGLFYLISERQYLLFPESLTFIARECPGLFKNWFNFYKKSLNLGLTTLSADEKTVQTFLAQSKQHLMQATPAQDANASGLFHKTLHDHNDPAASTPSQQTTQDARVHQQNLEHTIKALNNQGLMVGGLFGALHQRTQAEKGINYMRQDQTKITQQMDEDHTSTKEEQEVYMFELRQQMVRHQDQLRHTVAHQYPQLGPLPPKSSFSYTRNM